MVCVLCTQWCRYDFYLVPQAVNQGTVSPVAFNVIEDQNRLKAFCQEKGDADSSHSSASKTLGSLTLQYIHPRARPPPWPLSSPRTTPHIANLGFANESSNSQISHALVSRPERGRARSTR